MRFVFQISQSTEKNIPKNFRELEIYNFRPYQNTVMGGNFEFQVQDSFWNIFWGRLGDLKNESHFLYVVMWWVQSAPPG